MHSTPYNDRLTCMILLLRKTWSLNVFKMIKNECMSPSPVSSVLRKMLALHWVGETCSMLEKWRNEWMNEWTNEYGLSDLKKVSARDLGTSSHLWMAWISASSDLESHTGCGYLNPMAWISASSELSWNHTKDVTTGNKQAVVRNIPSWVFSGQVRHPRLGPRVSRAGMSSLHLHGNTDAEHPLCFEHCSLWWKESAKYSQWNLVGVAQFVLTSVHCFPKVLTFML